MEKTEIVLCDTSVIIDYYNGKNYIVEPLDKIGFHNIAINSVTYCEAIYGALNKKDFKKWIAFLDKFMLVYVNEEISKLSVEILKKYVLSHKLHLADAMIAATALYYETTLFTLNKRDFQFIDNLNLLL